MDPGEDGGWLSLSVLTELERKAGVERGTKGREREEKHFEGL